MPTIPGVTATPATEKLHSESTAIQRSDNLPAGDPKQAATDARARVVERLLAQVLAVRKDGLAQLKTLSNDNVLNLQSHRPLNAGQLVLLEVTQANGKQEVNVQTQTRPLIDQILRLLVPHGGDLKAKVAIASQIPLAVNNAATNPQPNLPPPANTGLLGLLKQLTQTTAKPAAPTPPNAPGLSSAPGNPAPTNSSILPTGNNPAPTAKAAPAVEGGITREVGQSSDPARPSLLQLLTPTAALREPGQISNLLQPGQMPALLKLVLPALRSTLNQAPLNAEQAQARDSQMTALTQVAARALLGALRAPNTGNEVEISRNEWVTRFEQSLDSLQVELNVVREQVREKDRSDQDNDPQAPGKVRQWRVRLAFDFAELGLITAFVLLSAEQKMEVQFWCEQERTRDKLQAFRNNFSQRLDSAVSLYGVEKLDVGVYDGTPPPSRQAIASHLIDETA